MKRRALFRHTLMKGFPKKQCEQKKKLWIFKREHDRIIYGWQFLEGIAA